MRQKTSVLAIFIGVLCCAALSGCGGDPSGDEQDPGDDPIDPNDPNDPQDGPTDPVAGFCTGAAAPDPLGPGSDILCFAGDDSPLPAASIESIFETDRDVNLIHLRLTLDPDFVDNSYGTNSVGWDGTKKGEHTFDNLEGSDKATLLIRDGNGDEAMVLTIDYITSDETAPSGYASQCVFGGDGKVEPTEAEDAIVACATSLDTNLNERGYASYIENSPPTTDLCTPSDEAPEWDYLVTYEVWIDASYFGAAGYGEAYINEVHASPSKVGDNSLNVLPTPCPPEECWEIDVGECDSTTTSTPEGEPCGDAGACSDGEFCSVEGVCKPKTPVE